MKDFDKIYWYRKFGRTRRFHTERIIGEETVFHHTASTAILLLTLVPEECTSKLIEAVLRHDLEEGITGDIPAPVKWRCQGIIDEMESATRESYGIPSVDLSDRESKLLKAADFLDATMTCLEQRMLGNTMIDTVFLNYVKFERKRNLITQAFSVAMYEHWSSIEIKYQEVCRANPSTVPLLPEMRSQELPPVSKRCDDCGSVVPPYTHNQDCPSRV